jgi:hypothetical protein
VTGAGSALPPASVVQAALRKITETLAAELAQPSATAPEWSEFDWVLAKAVSAMHGVSPLLSRASYWPGRTGWREFLEEQRTHTASRHGRIAELLRLIDQRTREQGIAAMALKGAALHALGVYAPGERPMADVDLLVHPRDAQHTAALIESLGYYESCTGWKERTFTPIGDSCSAPLGEHSNNAVKIELHERICEALPRRMTDISEALFSSLRQPGLNAYSSKAALMLHLLLHAAGGMVYQALRLVQLHDIALLASRMEPPDWAELLEYRTAGLWWALPPLQLTLRYYSSTGLAHIRDALRSDCPWHLGVISRRRMLSDVSYSHLWVDAFPGIEWSRSVVELLEYAMSRVRPSARHLALRVTLAHTQAWASDAQWSTLPQGRRILRWITSRQPRPVTMHVVRAALGVPNE